MKRQKLSEELIRVIFMLDTLIDNGSMYTDPEYTMLEAVRDSIREEIFNLDMTEMI